MNSANVIPDFRRIFLEGNDDRREIVAYHLECFRRIDLAGFPGTGNLLQLEISGRKT